MSDQESATSRDPQTAEPLETSASPSSAGVRPSRARSIVAVICVIVAGLLTTPAAVAYWGQRTLNDTQRYVDTVEPLVSSPEVQDVIATKVTDAIEKQVDVEAILNDVFAGVITDRPRLERLVGPLSASINGLIDREVRAFIASDEFADLWTRANTRAQQALQRVLKGDASGAVSLKGDEVVLDVDEVINQVKERLVARGLTLVQNVPVPETDRQVVLMEAPQVRQLRTIYAFGNPLARWLLPIVAAALPGRLRAGSAPSADGAGRSVRSWRPTRCWWRWRCRSGASCSSTSSPARPSQRPAGSSSTPCSPTSNVASGCSSDSVWSSSSPAGSRGRTSTAPPYAPA